MSYQPTTSGVNYPSPGYNPYYPYPIQPTYPFTPTYTPARQPNVTPTTYDATQVGTSAPVRGRIVKVDTDISPSDVPMDGFSSYFPAEDGSCIYVKHWDKDGKIQTTKFVPVPNDTSDFVPTASFEDEMRERMDTLENLLRQRNNYKPKYQKQNGSEHKDGGNDVRSYARGPQRRINRGYNGSKYVMRLYFKRDSRRFFISRCDPRARTLCDLQFWTC